MEQQDRLKKIIGHAKEYGFVFPSSEIYDGLSAVYDYGPNGVELKNNIKEYWWRAMVTVRENVVGLDAAIFMHPTVWKASGHLDAFHDPLIDNKDSKKRYRVDVLIEEHIEKLRKKIQKEVVKAEKRFGEDFRKAEFLATHPRAKKYGDAILDIENKYQQALEGGQLEDLSKLIDELEIVCPVSGTKNWTEVRQFNLMFKTEMGSVSEGANNIYLRPETAQGIFVNFLNVYKTGRMKVPFGIAQIGKAFRNEIIARQFIFRMREFEQMEMQFFIKPGGEKKWYAYWKEYRMLWHRSLGISQNTLRFQEHLKLAHYADAACDIEFDFPMGFKELEGIHSRTDFDLKSHEKASGKKLQYFDPEENESYTPFVIETSMGLDRMFFALLAHGLHEEKLEDNSERTVLKLPSALSPVKLAILPLVKKDGLAEKAKAVFEDLRLSFACQYDEKDAIGRRYRRQDAIGTPYCLTVDHETLENNSVTIRERDSMKQYRIPVEEAKHKITEEVDYARLLASVSKKTTAQAD